MASSRLPSTALSPLCALGPPPDGFTHTRGGTLRRRETTDGENRELDEQGSRHLCSSTGLARCRYRRIPCLALATSSASTQTTHHGPGPYFSILETSRPGIWLPFSLSFFSLLAPALRPVGFGLGIGLGWIAESPLRPYVVLDPRHGPCPPVLHTLSASPRPFLGIASSLLAVR